MTRHSAFALIYAPITLTEYEAERYSPAQARRLRESGPLPVKPGRPLERSRDDD